MTKVLWPETHFHLRRGFKCTLQGCNMSETKETVEFVRVHFSAAALQEAPGVPAHVDVGELARCVQGVVLQKQKAFECGPHLPHGFPRWDEVNFFEGKGPARAMLDLICHHFGLALQDMRPKKKPVRKQTLTCPKAASPGTLSAKKASVTKVRKDLSHSRSLEAGAKTPYMGPIGPWPAATTAATFAPMSCGGGHNFLQPVHEGFHKPSSQGAIFTAPCHCSSVSLIHGNLQSMQGAEHQEIAAPCDSLVWGSMMLPGTLAYASDATSPSSATTEAISPGSPGHLPASSNESYIESVSPGCCSSVSEGVWHTHAIDASWGCATTTETEGSSHGANLNDFVEFMDTFLGPEGVQDANQFLDMHATNVDPLLSASAEHYANCSTRLQSPPTDPPADQPRGMGTPEQVVSSFLAELVSSSVGAGANS